MSGEDYEKSLSLKKHVKNDDDKLTPSQRKKARDSKLRGRKDKFYE